MSKRSPEGRSFFKDLRVAMIHYLGELDRIDRTARQLGIKPLDLKRDPAEHRVSPFDDQFRCPGFEARCEDVARAGGLTRCWLAHAGQGWCPYLKGAPDEAHLTTKRKAGS